MDNLLVERTAGQLIGSSFSLYRQNFVRFFLIYLIPMLPLILLTQAAAMEGNLPLAFGAMALEILVGLVVWAAMIFMVMEIRIGNPPRLGSIAKRIGGGMIVKLLLTTILEFICIYIAFLLLSYP